MVKTRHISYQDADQSLMGYFAYPSTAKGLPGVLIAPAWLNVNDSICRRAERIAELGYAVLVADFFGIGIRPAPPMDPLQVIAPLMADRPRMRRRLLTGLHALQQQPECEPTRIAAVGYCMGGMGVLELARAGTSLRGVVSLHGTLDTPIRAEPGAILPRILVLHGDADPLVTFAHVTQFREEMRHAKARWQLTILGGAEHGFTGEGSVQGKTPGAMFHADAERFSWAATVGFLAEVLV